MPRAYTDAKSFDPKFVEQQLRALGCKTNMEAFMNPKEAIFRQYTEVWRRDKKAPNQEEIAALLNLSPSRVSDLCRSLEKDGRFIYTHRGWIPVVVQKKS